MMIVGAESWQNKAVPTKETGLGKRRGEGGKKGHRLGPSRVTGKGNDCERRNLKTVDKVRLVQYLRIHLPRLLHSPLAQTAEKS